MTKLVRLVRLGSVISRRDAACSCQTESTTRWKSPNWPPERLIHRRTTKQSKPGIDHHEDGFAFVRCSLLTCVVALDFELRLERWRLHGTGRCVTATIYSKHTHCNRERQSTMRSNHVSLTASSAVLQYLHLHDVRKYSIVRLILHFQALATPHSSSRSGTSSGHICKQYFNGWPYYN